MESKLKLRKSVFCLFYILTTIIILCAVISIFKKSWFFESQGIFILSVGVFTVWICDWIFYRFICKMLPDDSPIKEFDTKVFSSYIIGVLGFIFTNVNVFNYSPSYGSVVIMGCIIILPIIMLAINKYVFSIIGTTLIICMFALLIIQAHPSNNFEKYNEKLKIANDFNHEGKYIAAIDLYNNMLEDKYFVNNYTDSMLKIALDGKDSAQQSIGRTQYTVNETGVGPSVSISAPQILKNAIEYRITFSNNIGNVFTEKHIILNNFKADKEIIYKDNENSIVRLTNISAWSGYKNISIMSGAAKNEIKESFTTPQSISFRYVNRLNIIIEIILILILIIIPIHFTIILKLKEKGIKENV